MSGLLEDRSLTSDWDDRGPVLQGVVVARRKVGHGQWAGWYEVYDLNHEPPRIIRCEGLKRCWPVEREILSGLSGEPGTEAGVEPEVPLPLDHGRRASRDEQEQVLMSVSFKEAVLASLEENQGVSPKVQCDSDL